MSDAEVLLHLDFPVSCGMSKSCTQPGAMVARCAFCGGLIGILCALHSRSLLRSGRLVHQSCGSSTTATALLRFEALVTP
jgi:hypothetical protein